MYVSINQQGITRAFQQAAVCVCNAQGMHACMQQASTHCGVAWRGVRWRGVAWRGVAWRGAVCSFRGGIRGTNRIHTKIAVPNLEDAVDATCGTTSSLSSSSAAAASSSSSSSSSYGEVGRQAGRQAGGRSSEICVLVATAQHHDVSWSSVDYHGMVQLPHCSVLRRRCARVRVRAVRTGHHPELPQVPRGRRQSHASDNVLVRSFVVVNHLPRRNFPSTHLGECMDGRMDGRTRVVVVGEARLRSSVQRTTQHRTAQVNTAKTFATFDTGHCVAVLLAGHVHRNCMQRPQNLPLHLDRRQTPTFHRPTRPACLSLSLIHI